MAHVTLSIEKKRLLQQLPAILTGKAPDRYDIRRVFLSIFVWNLMKQVGEAFEQKSDGGPERVMTCQDLGSVRRKIIMGIR